MVLILDFGLAILARHSGLAILDCDRSVRFNPQSKI